MRQGGPNNGRRPRGRHHGGGGDRGDRGGHHGGGGNIAGNPNPRDNRPRSAASLRHQTFDSNCTDVRVRGNAWQVHEKYQALARDAQSSGDRVAAENYLQHAEHYYRIIEAINEATAVEQQHQRPGSNPTGGPVTTFGQQPEVPSNYYGTSGNPAPTPPPGNPNPGNSAEPSGNVAAPAQAEVHQKRPPVNPFFTPDETDDQTGSEPLAVRR